MTAGGLGALTVALVALVALPGRPMAPRLRALLRPSPGGVGRPRWRRWATRAGLGVVVLVAWPPGLVVLAGWWMLQPRIATWRAARRRRRAVVAGLPDAIDLLVLAVASGQTVALAVTTLSAAAARPYGPAFSEVARRVSRGIGVADALGALPEALGDPVRPLTAALTATERYGVALSATLETLAVEARRERRRQAEIAARKLPVRLCFPLVCCVLPAFGLLTVVPLLAGALASLRT